MFSPEGSPVSPSVSLDSEKDRRMTATSGRKCFAQYERYDPLGLLVKTLVESSAWYNPAVKLQWKVKPLYLKRLTKKRYSNKNTSLKPSAVILSKKDIPSSRLLFRLVPSKRRTEGTGFSLLPTVQTQGLKVCNEKGKTEFINLNMLPTPTSSDIKGSVSQKSMIRKDGRIRKDSLRNMPSIIGDYGNGSQLNPLFVEEMMGFPLMWSVLPFLSQHGEPDQSKGTETL